MYGISIAEIALSFTPKGHDGPILELYRILGYQWDHAGYNMVVVLTVILMVGGIMAYNGVKIVKRGLTINEA
jgi:hypothetical protein